MCAMPMGPAFHRIKYVFSAPSNDAPPAKSELLFTHTRRVDPDVDDPAEPLEQDFCPFEEQICAPEGDLSLEEEGWDGAPVLPDDRLEVAEHPRTLSDLLDLEEVEQAMDLYESTLPQEEVALVVPVVVGTPKGDPSRHSKMDDVRWKHRTVYGPDGVEITKWTPVESHGLHGRKRDAVKPEERREALLLKGRML